MLSFRQLQGKWFPNIDTYPSILSTSAVLSASPNPFCCRLTLMIYKPLPALLLKNKT